MYLNTYLVCSQNRSSHQILQCQRLQLWRGKMIILEILNDVLVMAYQYWLKKDNSLKSSLNPEAPVEPHVNYLLTQIFFAAKYKYQKTDTSLSKYLYRNNLVQTSSFLCQEWTRFSLITTRISFRGLCRISASLFKRGV